MSKMSQLVMERDEEMAEKLNSAAAKINSGKDTKSTPSTNIRSNSSIIQEVSNENAVSSAKADKKPSFAGNKEFESFRKYVIENGLALRKPGTSSVYLKSEAWLYLAHLKGVVPSVTVLPEYDNYGKVIRVFAVCKLYDKDGEEYSQSSMIATKDEQFLKDLDDYAVFGMAETRAISRAVRNVFGYVVQGAGFETTPAAEMGLEKAVRE